MDLAVVLYLEISFILYKNEQNCFHAIKKHTLLSYLKVNKQREFILWKKQYFFNAKSLEKRNYKFNMWSKSFRKTTPSGSSRSRSTSFNSGYTLSGIGSICFYYKSNSSSIYMLCSILHATIKLTISCIFLSLQW